MQYALEYPTKLKKLVVVDITPTISSDARFKEIQDILLGNSNSFISSQIKIQLKANNE